MIYSLSSKDHWLRGVPLVQTSVLLKSEQAKNIKPTKDMRPVKAVVTIKPHR